MTPRVSIIVPSYNHGRFVAACVESVLNQSMTDWEMIVVDDGSKDDSLELFRSFDDARIKVFENPENLGTYGTENRAVSLAKADLIAVLNSDDAWLPSKLEKQLALFEQHADAAMCYTLGWTCDENGISNEELDLHADWPQSERHELLPYLLELNRVLASSVVFRKPYARFDEGLRYSGDWLATLQAAFVAPVCLVPERLTLWRQHGTNAHQVRAGVTREEIHFRNWLIQSADKFNLDRFSPEDKKQLRHRLGLCWYHLNALYLLYGNQSAAVGAAIKSAFYLRGSVPSLKRVVASTLMPKAGKQRMWPNVSEKLEWRDVLPFREPLWQTPK